MLKINQWRYQVWFIRSFRYCHILDFHLPHQEDDFYKTYILLSVISISRSDEVTRYVCMYINPLFSPGRTFYSFLRCGGGGCCMSSVLRIVNGTSTEVRLVPGIKYRWNNYREDHSSIVQKNNWTKHSVCTPPANFCFFLLGQHWAH